MQSISIIVEGKADEKFITDFIKARFGSSGTERVKFVLVDGKVEKLNLAQHLIQGSTYSERVNLLIFDGDDNNVVETEVKIRDKANELDLVFNNTFLFPDNATQGNLEVVLRNIAVNRNLFSCIDSYQLCISQLESDQLRNIDEKAKMFIYIDSFENAGSAKEGARDYSNSNLWNLNSDYLIPLYNFLSPYFSQDEN